MMVQYKVLLFKQEEISDLFKQDEISDLFNI